MATLAERIIEHGHETPERNPGVALDLARVASVEVNRSAVERRAATLPARRTVKKEWQAAWLLRAITCIDLTTLSGDDTPGAVQRLCAKARQPVKFELLEQLGALSLPIRVGAVCVYHALVPVAVEALAGSGHSRRGRLDGLPRRAESAAAEAGGDSRIRRRRGARDRHRHLAGARPHRKLAGALRRGARLPRGVWRRAHEDDIGDGRVGDATQRGAGKLGLHDGGR